MLAVVQGSVIIIVKLNDVTDCESTFAVIVFGYEPASEILAKFITTMPVLIDYLVRSINALAVSDKI